MKALTFLGASPYKIVNYVWQDEQVDSVRTHLFPEAVARIFKPQKLVVFVTETARQYQPSDSKQSHLDTLQERLRDLDVLIEPIDIPEGRSPQELWDIFKRVASSVSEKETILLDVTHAFRSIPLIVFAVAAYLRRTKNVTIEHILYGAFEARSPFGTPPQEDCVPIFDLAPLLELLDWTSGAEALFKRGEAGLIADKMIAAHQTLRRTGTGTPAKLKTLGQKLQEFSQALHLSRPREVMKQAHELLSLLEETRHEFEQWALPFALLAEQIRHELEPLAFDKPDILSRENLERQLQLVKYYRQKGLLVQAFTLAREWVVSYTLLKGNQEKDWLNRQTRTQAEKALSSPEDFEHFSIDDELANLWKELGQLRNDLAHCGMRTDAARIGSITKQAETLPTRLEGLLEKLQRS